MGTSSSSLRSLDDVKVLKTLGQGAFGLVTLVELKESGALYAMKEMNKAEVIRQNLVEHTMLERDVMLESNNPFIVNLHCCFQTEENLYFLMDFIPGGSLWSHLVSQEENCFSEKHTVFYTAEILLGIENLHERDIVYRDLKPENVMIGKDGHIILTDFGLSHNLKSTANGKVLSFSGTAFYVSPEVVSDVEHDKRVDWWALGVVIHLLLCGEPPFYSKSIAELFEMIRAGKIEIAHPNLSDTAIDIISKLLVRDPEQRLGSNGAQEVKEHPFFKDIDFKKAMNKELEPPFVPKEEEVPLSRKQKSTGRGKHKRNRSMDSRFDTFSIGIELENDRKQSSTEARSKFQALSGAIPFPKRKRTKQKSSTIQLTTELAPIIEKSEKPPKSTAPAKKKKRSHRRAFSLSGNAPI